MAIAKCNLDINDTYLTKQINASTEEHGRDCSSDDSKQYNSPNVLKEIALIMTTIQIMYSYSYSRLTNPTFSAISCFSVTFRRRKTLISNRGRWSPLSLFRQVHLGVGKSENNPPFSGLQAASTWEAVGFCGSHRQTDVLAKCHRG